MQESEHVCREKWRGLGNYFLQYFGIWHELDSHECWRDSNFRLKGMHYFLLSLCAFLRHAGWNPESDLGKWAIIIKIIRTLRKSAHRSQPWKTARAKIKPEKSVTLGVKQEKKAGSRHRNHQRMTGQQWYSPSLFHQTWVCLLFQGENFHLASDKPSRIVSSVSFAGKGTQ